ncbi:MAG TPA: AMP-binding protein [Candidatus Eremiobacteraeota bacterium]|nr:MAG: putative sulfoacetate--CoA ligase [bacterium ADurb.Bin363]HPZ09329.1 AMP-binding protein [Candidatus Eremiobacteraeota bacterium]
MPEIDFMKDLFIYNIIKYHGEISPDSIAILAPEREPLTYRHFLGQIDYVKEKLNSMGHGRNDIIATVLPNGPDMAVTFISIASCATCAPLNPRYSTGEFSFYLSDLNAKSVIIQEGIESPVIEVAKNLGISVIKLSPSLNEEAGIFTLNGRECSVAKDITFASLEDIALVLHTSGTTSRPKIVPLSQANICASAYNIRTSLSLTSEDRCLNIMPLFHIHGLIGALLSSLVAGASIVCTPDFLAPEFFDWIKEFSPTWYTAVPTMHQSILDRADENKEIISKSKLRFIRSCSSSLLPKVFMELKEVFKVPVIEAYGMTEASHQICCNPLPPGEAKAGSAGIATGTEVAIMDESGNILKVGKKGEIVIKGPGITEGYKNNEEANKSAFTDGWFRTGDEGFIDVEGYLFITGRIKEIINRGGEKISPGEIDEVLMSHSAVRQAVTFSVPHEKLGEDVASAVVLKDNASATEIELREFTAGKLTYFKVPCQIIILKEIPKGPTGKIQRIGLSQKLGITSLMEQRKEKAEFIEAETPLKKEVAKIWSTVLNLKQVGINDKFLSLGGDSILASQIISRLRDKFQVELSLTRFFASPTIKDQARIIEELILEEIEELPE